MSASYAQAWVRSLDIRVGQGRLKQRTCDEYARILDTYISPTFGSTAIGAISPTLVEDFAAVHAHRHSTSYRHIWHVFARVLGQAVRQGAISANPMDDTELEVAQSPGVSL